MNDMAKELNVSKGTLFKYLKIGAELGLCDYVPGKIKVLKKK